MKWVGIGTIKCIIVRSVKGDFQSWIGPYNMETLALITKFSGSRLKFLALHPFKNYRVKRKGKKFLQH